LEGLAKKVRKLAIEVEERLAVLPGRIGSPATREDTILDAEVVLVKAEDVEVVHGIDAGL
jgi:hypothetical protein